MATSPPDRADRRSPAGIAVAHEAASGQRRRLHVALVTSGAFKQRIASESLGVAAGAVVAADVLGCGRRSLRASSERTLVRVPTARIRTSGARLRDAERLGVRRRDAAFARKARPCRRSAGAEAETLRVHPKRCRGHRSPNCAAAEQAVRISSHDPFAAWASCD